MKKWEEEWEELIKGIWISKPRKSPSLAKRIDRLGVAKTWRKVVAWAEQSKKVEALDAIVETLEEADYLQFLECDERARFIRMVGRSRDTVKNTPAEPGGAALAEEVCKDLVAAINRAEQVYRYDRRLGRAERHLVAARRILKEPPDPPDFVKQARASRKPGGPRKTFFHRAAVEKTLTNQLLAIAPEGETRANARSLAIKLLSKLES